VLLTKTGPRCISFRCKITVSLAQGAVHEADVADPVLVRSIIRYCCQSHPAQYFSACQKEGCYFSIGPATRLHDGCPASSVTFDATAAHSASGCRRSGRPPTPRRRRRAPVPPLRRPAAPRHGVVTRRRHPTAPSPCWPRVPR